MKSFLKYTLATIVGLLLFSIIATIITVVSMAGMMAGEGSAKIEKNSILRIPLNASLEERTDDGSMPFGLNTLMGEKLDVISLEDALTALEKAADNKNIKGVYLEGGSLSASPAMVEELRTALMKFKESGKWVMAYGDDFSRNAYYLASAADSILLNPQGSVNWSGMSTQLYFLKDVLEKAGVKMQVFKVGTYKSAVEPFICSEMSEANREQVTSFLTSIWNNMNKTVAESRKMEADKLNAIADTQTGLTDPQETLEKGLVDKLCYISEAKDILKQKAGEDDDDDLEFVSVKDMAKTETIKKKVSDEIAVYYAYGDIVTEKGGGLPTGGHSITSKGMTKDLQELREDDDVKAVVIRVNSGGGSAYASEQIWHEVTLLKEKKPVIISMGGMAASGGYYISCAANKILAEPTTLTGSIGIFGMIPDPSELLTKKVGVKFDGVKTNELSDFGAMGRPLNETESSIMQTYIEKGYDLFTRRVADGRGISQDSVKVIAEGRVWTGEQALEIGLVDQLGDLNDAIAAAAEAASLKKYSVGRYPEAEPWYVGLMDKQKDDYMESQMRSVLGEFYTTFGFLQNLKNQDLLQARMPFFMNLE